MISAYAAVHMEVYALQTSDLKCMYLGLFVRAGCCKEENGVPPSLHPVNRSQSANSFAAGCPPSLATEVCFPFLSLSASSQRISEDATIYVTALQVTCEQTGRHLTLLLALAHVQFFIPAGLFL